MDDLKKRMIPVFKVIDQLDKEAVLAICGVMLLLTMILGGLADVFAMLVGCVAGIAIYKKFLS